MQRLTRRMREIGLLGRIALAWPWKRCQVGNRECVTYGAGLSCGRCRWGGARGLDRVARAGDGYTLEARRRGLGAEGTMCDLGPVDVA